MPAGQLTARSLPSGGPIGVEVRSRLHVGWRSSAVNLCLAGALCHWKVGQRNLRTHNL